jgi:NTP pyrophosphatase (non-canonical NTP hydrolase)
MRAYYHLDKLVDDVNDQAADKPELNDKALLLVGLAEEVGEVAGVIKKHVRDGKPLDNVKGELADVCWYLLANLRYYGLSIDDAARIVLEKLYARRAAGKM